MVTPRKTPSDRQAPRKRAASGNPAKATKATSSSGWKRANELDLVTLPSGNTAQIKRVQLTTLLADGLFSDALGAEAMKLVKDGAQIDPAVVQKMGEDPEKVAAALDGFDKVAVRCFVDPEVLYYKDDDGKVIPNSQRGDELYSDDVALEDKIFLFQLMGGGSDDLASFREQFGAALGGVATL